LQWKSCAADWNGKPDLKGSAKENIMLTIAHKAQEKGKAGCSGWVGWWWRGGEVAVVVVVVMVRQPVVGQVVRLGGGGGGPERMLLQ
jgi:hypothetical protein